MIKYLRIWPLPVVTRPITNTAKQSQLIRNVAGLSKAAYGAEARYEIANCFFIQNRLSDAEKAAFEVINKAGSYEQWVTKAYIVIGRCLFQTERFLQCESYFQSVIENAKIEELRLEAERKLKQVKKKRRRGVRWMVRRNEE